MSSTTLTDPNSQVNSYSNPRLKRFSSSEKTDFLLFLFQRSQHFPKEDLKNYALRHQISRTSLYELQNQAFGLLSPQKPGPKPKSQPSPLPPADSPLPKKSILRPRHQGSALYFWKVLALFSINFQKSV